MMLPKDHLIVQRWQPFSLSNLIALGVAYYQIQGAFYIGAVIILALALPILFLAFTIAKNEG